MSETGQESRRQALLPDEIADVDIESAEDVFDTINTAGIQFEDQFVKDNLDNILLFLISIRGGANGKQLTEDVARAFNCVISSGTLYPYLYDLEDDGLLESKKHVQTREYVISNREEVTSILETWVTQHLALGTVISSSLD